MSRQRSRRETTLASMWRLRAEAATSEPAVFGSRVVQQTFFQQIVHHSRFERCILLASPFDRPALQGSMDRLAARGSAMRSWSVRSTTSLLTDADWLAEFTAWHEVDERGQFARELRAARKARFPITTTCHAFSYREQLHDLYARLLLSDTRPYDAHVCTSRAGATAFRGILERVAAQLPARRGQKLAYRGRIETIPLGVDTERFRPGDKAALRRKLELPEDALILLYLGRLSFVDKADLQPLLGVFRELRRANPRRRLLLLLAGSSVAGCATMLWRHCQDLGIAERVRILSPLSDAARPRLFAAADIFVSPADSIQEAFGQTPLEAMAAGLPQVVSDWDGYRDTVVDGETGVLLPTYAARCDRDLVATPLLDWDLLDHALLAQALVVDVRRMREALQRLIADDALREQWGLASRKRALAHFSWEVVMGRYDALWSELGAEAATSRFRPAPPGYLRCSFSDAFRGYPTARLGPATRVRLTDSGRAVLEGDAALPAYFAAAAESLDLDALGDALRALAKGGATLRQAARAITRPGWHEDHALRHVLFHLKQGFAETVSRRRERGSADGAATRVDRGAKRG